MWGKKKKKKWVGRNYISHSFGGLNFLSLTYLAILSVPLMFSSAQKSEHTLTEDSVPNPWDAF